MPLELTGEPENVSVADTAKLVRFALAKAFSGQKFTVHYLTRDMAVRVYWVGGPSQREVNQVIERYSGGGLELDIDAYYWHEHYLLPDGSAFIRYSEGTIELGGHYHKIDNRYFDEIAPEGTRRVKFKAFYISGERDDSEQPLS